MIWLCLGKEERCACVEWWVGVCHVYYRGFCCSVLTDRGEGRGYGDDLSFLSFFRMTTAAVFLSGTGEGKKP